MPAEAPDDVATVVEPTDVAKSLDKPTKPEEPVAQEPLDVAVVPETFQAGVVVR